MDINAAYLMHDNGQPVSFEKVELENDRGIFIDSEMSLREHITKK